MASMSHEFDATMASSGLVDVSNAFVLVSALPLLFLVCLASWMWDLGLVQNIWVSSLRTFVQLSVLGHILKPIFVEGLEHWYVVIGYLLLMVLLAARESAQRPKYHFPGMFWW